MAKIAQISAKYIIHSNITIEGVVDRPDVIGAIFGMNFSHIPAAHHVLGFWAAIGAMIVSAVGPYLLFKRRGWL